MWRHTRCTLPVAINRSYMKALRDLLGLNQYTIVRQMMDERIIRESQVSCIEGKIGYEDLWVVYAQYFDQLIEESPHLDGVKDVMRTLLKTWREA